MATYKCSLLHMLPVCAVCHLDAVRMNPATASTSRRDVEVRLKTWLRQAGDRDGGRKRRYERVFSQTLQRASSGLNLQSSPNSDN